MGQSKNKIKICGITYKIVISKKDQDSEINRGTNTITINGQLSKNQQRLALWHEIMHGINNEIQSEIEIEMLAQGVFQVLEDNPWLKS